MFHLCKSTRVYNGEPYCGYSSNGIPQEFHTIKEAEAAQARLQEHNPVGWNIWNSETFQCVRGKNILGAIKK